MDLDIAPCDPHALGPLEAALDREFVLDRGRGGTIRDRYPLAFDEASGSRFLVASQGGEQLACLAARPFSWRREARGWRGVMIGLVYTAPAARGRGLGSRLLRATLALLAAEGIEFAVLWSRIGGFYEACGFQRADRGRLGSVRGVPGTGASPPGMPLRSLSDLESAGLERARRRRPAALMRAPLAWHTTPLPSAEVRLLREGPASEPAAHLLFGTHAGTRIVYELEGDPASFPVLWAQLADGAGEILVNDVEGSPSTSWLEANTPITWQDQNLALWAALCPAAHDVDFASWYIPYFDRL